MMDADSALRLLGKFSRWQIQSYLCCASAFGVAFSWILMTVVFIADTPNYRCALPENGTVDEWIPLVEKDGRSQYDQCSMYVEPGVSNATVPCQYGYWYDPDSGYESTISMEWDLVCDKAWLVELSMSMQAVGKMIGALVFNHLSDRYGRKMVFLSCLWCNVIIASSRSFSPNLIMYSLFVFMGGAVQQGFVSSSYVMAVELFPTDQRSTAGTVIEMFWAAGYMAVAGMAYVIRNWRYLELATALPFIFTIGYYWVLSESLPWLVANNKLQEAEELIQKAAKMSGQTIPANVFVRPLTPVKCCHSDVTSTDASLDETSVGLIGDKVSHDDSESSSDNYKPVLDSVTSVTTPDDVTESFSISTDLKLLDSREEGTSEGHSQKYGLRDIVRSRTMLMYTGLLVTVWFVLCFAYNAMGIMVIYLPGNRYLNFFLYALFEVPAYLLTWLLAVRASRRFSMMALCLTGGILLLAVTILDTYDVNGKYWILMVALNMVGKFLLTTALSLVYVIVPEIFPTNMRNVGMGLCQMFGRFGALVGPFARVLYREVKWLPTTIMGVLCIISGIMCLIIPETRKLPLPDTIEQVENMRRQAKMRNKPAIPTKTIDA